MPNAKQIEVIPEEYEPVDHNVSLAIWRHWPCMFHSVDESNFCSSSCAKLHRENRQGSYLLTQLVWCSEPSRCVLQTSMELCLPDGLGCLKHGSAKASALLPRDLLKSKRKKICISALRCRMWRSKWPPVAQLSKPQLCSPGYSKCCICYSKQFNLSLPSLCTKHLENQRELGARG